MTIPQPERAPPAAPAIPDDPPRSEALEAELAALEAILPAGAPRPETDDAGAGVEPPSGARQPGTPPPTCV